jgi:hypothetical protein
MPLSCAETAAASTCGRPSLSVPFGKTTTVTMDIRKT